MQKEKTSLSFSFIRPVLVVATAILLSGCATSGNRETFGTHPSSNAWTRSVIQKILDSRWYDRFRKIHHRRPVLAFLSLSSTGEEESFGQNGFSHSRGAVSMSALRRAAIDSDGFLVVAGRDLRNLATNERAYLMGHASTRSIKEPHEILGEDLVIAAHYLDSRSMDIVVMSIKDNRIILDVVEQIPGNGERKAIPAGLPRRFVLENALPAAVRVWVNPSFMPMMLGYDNLATVPGGAAPDAEISGNEQTDLSGTHDGRRPKSIFLCLQFSTGPVISSCKVWRLNPKSRFRKVEVIGADQYGFPVLKYDTGDKP
jgi:hypothetical protein